jgi:hypothetical protein
MIGFSARLLSVDVQSERRVWRLKTASRFGSLSDYVKSDEWHNLSTMVQADLSDVALAKSEEINPPMPNFLPETDAPPCLILKDLIQASQSRRFRRPPSRRFLHPPWPGALPGLLNEGDKSFAVSIDPAGSASGGDFSPGDEKRELEGPARGSNKKGSRL